jgi:glycosyltransferase involved in cell wall biosynthesis
LIGLIEKYKKFMISIIIPTLNEEEGIAKVICSIPEEIRKISELIVIDVSTDMTPIIAERLGAKVIRGAKKGKGWQMRQAVKESKGDILVFLDGDGTHPGQYIPKLIKKLKGANLVLGCGSSKETKDPEMRRYFELWNVISYPTTQMLGLKVSDPLAGFRAIRRSDWDKLNLKSDEFEIETEMNIKAIKNKFVIEQVLIPNIRRAGGFAGSKFSKNPKMWLKIYTMLSEYKKEKDKG